MCRNSLQLSCGCAFYTVSELSREGPALLVLHFTDRRDIAKQVETEGREVDMRYAINTK